MPNKKAILLLSGGIDSTTILAWLTNQGKQVYALSFDYGQSHLLELEYAINNAKKYRVIAHHIIRIDNSLFKLKSTLTNGMHVSTYSDNAIITGTTDVYVPYRNQLFVTYALTYAEIIHCSSIYVGFNKDDSNNFPDCTPEFLQQINNTIAAQSCLENSTKVLAPFLFKTKKEIIRIAEELNVNLKETITCYQPNGHTECGHCLSCLTKAKAIRY